MDRSLVPLMLLPAMGCDGQLWARQIMDLATGTSPPSAEVVSSLEEVAAATDVVSKIYINGDLRDYMVDVVQANIAGEPLKNPRQRII